VHSESRIDHFSLKELVYKTTRTEGERFFGSAIAEQLAESLLICWT
jgi:hypothetical protein